MVSEVFFFTYIFAGFVGLLVILMVLLLTRYRTDGNRNLLSAIRNFMICTALIDALYFYFDYKVLATGHHVTSPILRIMDICLFIGQVYFWSVYVREKSGFRLRKRRKPTQKLPKSRQKRLKKRAEKPQSSPQGKKAKS